MASSQARVLAFAFFAALVAHFDRACIATAAPAISRDLGLSSIQMGYVFSAFSLTYALFEIPGGWFADKLGERPVLIRIVACWSVFTALTGASWNYISLVSARLVFGAAEAGAFPSLSRMLSRWFPLNQRAGANGLLWMGARTGAALAPLATSVIILKAGWRAAFVTYSTLGVLWCVAFAIGYQPPARKAESAHPAVTPWGRLFSSGTLWALFAMYLCSNYGLYFFVTWLPTFLMKDHGLTLKQSGILSTLPLAGGALGCVAGGTLSDWLARRTGSLKWSRRAIGITAFSLAAAGFGAASFAQTGAMAVLFLTLAQTADDLVKPVSWATVVDVGADYGATASGFMNMASSIAAMLVSMSAAWLSTTFGSFAGALAVASGLYILSALLWLLIDPAKRILTSQ